MLNILFKTIISSRVIPVNGIGGEGRCVDIEAWYRTREGYKSMSYIFKSDGSLTLIE